VVVGLCLLALVLITISFREPATGPLHGVQSAGATVLRPFEVAAERVARPFRDVYGYFAGLVHVKRENARLKAEVNELRQKALLGEAARAAHDWAASDRGRRLDHVWVTEPLAPALARAEIVKEARGWELPSDHVPVLIDIG